MVEEGEDQEVDDEEEEEAEEEMGRSGRVSVHTFRIMM